MTRASTFPVILFALGLALLILSCVRTHAEPRFIGAMLVYQHTDPAFEKNGLANGLFFTWLAEGDRTPVTCGIYEGSFGKPAATCNIGFDWATWSLDGLEGALTPFVGLSYYPAHGSNFDTQLGRTDFALTAGVSLRQALTRDGFGLWASVSPTGGRHVVVAGGFMMELGR